MALTEKDFDYVVTCVKHCYNDHVVLHFKVGNTLENQSFHNVQLRVALQDDEDLATMKPLYAIPAKEIESNSEASTYVCLQRDPDMGYPTGSCSVTIVFAMEEGEEADEYELPEEVVFNLSDYLAQKYLPTPFDEAWDAADDAESTELVYELDTLKNLQTAADEIVEFYQFLPHEGCQMVPTDSQTLSHTLKLSGQVLYNPPFDILIKAVVCEPFPTCNQPLTPPHTDCTHRIWLRLAHPHREGCLRRDEAAPVRVADRLVVWLLAALSLKQLYIYYSF